jgi:hypothetical protein
MTEQIPLEVLDAIRKAMEETARRFAKDKGMPAPAASDPATESPREAQPGVRPHWRFL